MRRFKKKEKRRQLKKDKHRRRYQPSRRFWYDYWDLYQYYDDTIDYNDERGEQTLMPGSCHLERASNVIIGVEWQIFVIVIFFNCGYVLHFDSHSKY